MQVEWKRIAHLLIDPVDRSPLAVEASGQTLVSASGNRYELVDGQPVLFPPTGHESGGWRFPPIELFDSERPKPARPLRSIFGPIKRMLRRGVGRQGAGAAFVAELRSVEGRPLVLVVGGASVGEGSRAFVDDAAIDVVSFDVYPTSSTTLVADGHRIPLADESVDAAWVQAVLEHVYRPDDVIAEIVRVLRPDGVIYAETPFLQPVHEGAFDFRRFSHSGHRLLFSRFDELESGPLGGPAAVLNLAIRGVVGGLTRSTTLARAAYALTQPLVLLDRFVPEPWRVDFATGSYFLGRRRATSAQSFDAPRVYRGAD